MSDNRSWRDRYPTILERQLQNLTRFGQSSPSPSQIEDHAQTIIALHKTGQKYPHLHPFIVDLANLFHSQMIALGLWHQWSEVVAFTVEYLGDDFSRPDSTKAIWLSRQIDLWQKLNHEALEKRVVQLRDNLFAIKSPYLFAYSTFTLSEGYQSLIQFQKQDELIESANEHFRLIHLASGADQVGEVYMDLAQVHLWRRKGVFDHAISKLTKHIDCIQKSNADQASSPLPILYDNRGMFFWLLGQNDRSMQDREAALKLFKLREEFISAVIMQGKMGLVCFFASDFKNGIDLMLACIQAGEKINAIAIILPYIGYLAVLYIGIGEFEKAKIYLDRQFTLAQTLNRLDQAIIATGNRGFCCLFMGDYASAIPHFKTDLEYWEDPIKDNNFQKIYIRICLILCYVGLNQTESANQIFTEIDIICVTYRPSKVLNFLINRAKSYFLAGEDQWKILELCLSEARQLKRYLDEAGILLQMTYCSTAPKSIEFQNEATKILRRIGSEKYGDILDSNHPIVGFLF